MDDVTFGRNGRDAERWWLTRAATAVSSVAILGGSLMSMNALFLNEIKIKRSATNTRLLQLYQLFRRQQFNTFNKNRFTSLHKYADVCPDKRRARG